jgi:hypothetical protein
MKRTLNTRPMNDLILEHLNIKGHITSVEAAALFRCRSLSRRIRDLKDRGYIIHSDHRTDSTGQRYVRYIVEGAKVAA